MKTQYNEKRFSDFRQLLSNSASEFGNKEAFLVKIGTGAYRKIGYDEFYKRYITLCTEFLNMGLLGKPIAIIGKNSYEWLLSYTAAATVGIAVPLDKELKSEDIKALTLDAKCEAVCSDSSKLECFKDGDGYICKNVFDFSQIDEISSHTEKADYKAVDDIKIEKDKMQILIFTSGTTGSSKGVCLSQYNICSNIFQTVTMVKVKRSDVTLSMLPIHHTYECTLDCLTLLSRGACITFADGLTKVANNLIEYKPSILVVVPAILNLLSKRIKAGILKSCPAKYKPLFENNSLSYALSHIPAILRIIICKKVKATLGGKIRLFIVGAAPIEKELIDDFTSLGIRTLQGYGLTECSPLLAGNSDFFFDAETTGRAIPYVSLKIDEPNEEGIGEILAKGDNIMLGYYNDEKATAAVFKDGWFRTGDMGKMDERGALTICGRCKSVIVNEKGKNIYPEELEKRILEYPEISEVLVLSHTDDDKVLIKAKIFPKTDEIKALLGHEPSEQEIRDKVYSVIKLVNEKLPNYKHIKVIEILENEFEKTSTRKIKRFGTNVQ